MKDKQIIRGDVWNDCSVKKAASLAKNRIFCIAYVTQADLNLFKNGDVLICDASKKAVSCGETDPHFLLKLVDIGVSVYTCEALHVKCALFDDYVLIGSSNMSESSASRLVELAVLQKDRVIALDLQSFLLELECHSELVSEKQLKALAKFWKVKQSPWQIGFNHRQRVRDQRTAANHIVTVTTRFQSPRNVSQDSLDKSEAKAVKNAEDNGIISDGFETSYYYTSEKWGANKPKIGDSIIVICYSSGKKRARALVRGVGKVFAVDKIGKVHVVHYVVPSDRRIPYGAFREKFNGKKSMNRSCVSDNNFNMMAEFLSSYKD